MLNINKDVAAVMVSLGKKGMAKFDDTYYLYDPFVRVQGTKGGQVTNKTYSGKWFVMACILCAGLGCLCGVK